MVFKELGSAQIYLSLMLLSSKIVSSLPHETLTQISETVTPTSSDPVAQETSGSINTELETNGVVASAPFPTTFQEEAPYTLSTYAASTVAMNTTANFLDGASRAVDPFQPVATAAPPSQITSRDNHVVPRLGIEPQDSPLQTNKFYANLFLGSQRHPVWTHPYSVTWSGGGGTLSSWGLAISQTDASQRAMGPPNEKIAGAPASNFINPTGIQSLIMSAAELGSNTILTTDSLRAFAVNANLRPSPESQSRITFPLVQGMGFVTGIYQGLRPHIESGVFIGEVAPMGTVDAGIYKYRISLADGSNWLMYAIPENGADPAFVLASQTLIQGPEGFVGTIQIAKNPGSQADEATMDAAAGAWATDTVLSGSVDGSTGSYSLAFQRGGNPAKTLLMYALPHHQASFDEATRAAVKGLRLATTTKGEAVAVAANAWTMVEPELPVEMGFAPWTPDGRHAATLSPEAQAAVRAAAEQDVQQDVLAQSNIDSFYFAGKALSKFAHVVWAAQNLANAPDVAATGLAKLKEAFAVWTANANMHPLIYETSWKGVVSGVWDDGAADFGNAFYNDHHFHFSYFVHAAAMIGTLDPAWAQANKDYINAMVRDSNNPSAADNFFPVFRGFDWFHGHSWAKGLFESADGKDQESSSEDVMHAYALKMWGAVIGDAATEARGNLMLGVLRRSVNAYFLLASDNAVQPAQFIGNKVTGILFENKIDHVTYFGANLEYIQGIQMIPLTSASAYTRPPAFVQEEWDVYFSERGAQPVDTVAGGWRGILYSNLALVDPRRAYAFFADPAFDPAFLDGGASRTWSLAFAAGLGGA